MLEKYRTYSFRFANLLHLLNNACICFFDGLKTYAGSCMVSLNIPFQRASTIIPGLILIGTLITSCSDDARTNKESESGVNPSNKATLICRGINRDGAPFTRKGENPCREGDQVCDCADQ